MFITYISESANNERSDFINKNFQHEMKKNKTLNPLFEMDNKKMLFARTLVKNIYENIIYKEDFEVEENDSMSSRFANSVITNQVAGEIYKTSISSIPLSAPAERFVEAADILADQLTLDWFDDSRLEMVAADEAIKSNESKGVKVSEGALASKFDVFKEFKVLSEITKTDDGDVSTALISEMSDLEKSKLALKISTFKKCLEAIGIDTKSERMSNIIKEEFNKNLF